MESAAVHGPAQATPDVTSPDRYAVRFVWGLWAVLLVSLLTYVNVFAADIPFLDEYDLVDAFTGHLPIDIHWLWSQHNEHRIVLPRLIHLGLGWLTNYDFRAGTYFNVIALAGLAAGMIVAARRLRGRTSYADSFFPLALLNYGHCENLLWGFQIEFVMSTLLACELLVLVLRSNRPPNWRSVSLAGACLLALPLTGAHGIPFVPPLALWLVIWAWRHRLGSSGFALTTCAAAIAVMAMLLIGVYFIGYTFCEHHPHSAMWVRTYRVTRQFLAMAGGIGVIPFWGIARYLVVAIIALCALALVRRCWILPSERVRCLGFLSFLSAMLGLAVAVGWGRGGMGQDMGFGFRYVTLSVPWICAVFFLAQICPSRTCTRASQVALAVMMALLLVQNTKHGLMHAVKCKERFDAVRHDIQRGAPISEIAHTHTFLYPLPDRLADSLEKLRAAGIGPWRFTNLAVVNEDTCKSEAIALNRRP